MALEIGIGDRISPKPLPSEPSIWLDRNGEYYFLHPLFEQLRAETGEYIDLYGDASFSGEGLVALEKMLVQAIRLVSSQPTAWQVHTATQLKPVRQELYAQVEKAHLVDLLSRWKQIVGRAEELGRPVVCFGD